MLFLVFLFTVSHNVVLPNVSKCIPIRNKRFLLSCISISIICTISHWMFSLAEQATTLFYTSLRPSSHCSICITGLQSSKFSRDLSMKDSLDSQPFILFGKQHPIAVCRHIYPWFFKKSELVKKEGYPHFVIPMEITDVKGKVLVDTFPSSIPVFRHLSFGHGSPRETNPKSLQSTQADDVLSWGRRINQLRYKIKSPLTLLRYQ